MSSLFNCIDSAVKQGAISPDQAEAYKERYRRILKTVKSATQAKAQFEESLLAEAQSKQRRSFITETKRKYRDIETDAYRDFRGEPDPATAINVQISRTSHEGTWKLDSEMPADAYIGQSAEELAKGVYTRAMGKAAALTREFEKGFFLGELRRKISPTLQTRELNIIRELGGVSTGDATAKKLAGIVKEVQEDLRLAHNAEGGEIGKLDSFIMPQVWNPTAVLRMGQDKFEDFIMRHLWKEKMVDNLTGRPLSEDEMREGVRISWERIVTDGRSEAEVTSAPTGRGATWKQHSDHRWMHFKPDDWIIVQKELGSGDFYQAFVNHVGSMSRDIGFMMKFGPNPQVMLQYLFNRLRARAANLKPMERVIREQTAKLNRYYEELREPSAEDKAAIEEHGAILRQLDKLRSSKDGRYYYRQRHRAWIEDGSAPRADGTVGDTPTAWDKIRAGDERIKRVEAETNALMQDLMKAEDKLREIQNRDVDLSKAAVHEKINALLDEMKAMPTWSPRQKNSAPSYAEAKIAQAETLWAHVRGQLSARNDPRFLMAWDDFRAEPSFVAAAEMAKQGVKTAFGGAGMSAQRTATSAFILGNAVWASLLNDPVAMATRAQFIGMPWHKSTSVGMVANMIKALADDAEFRQHAMASMVTADDANQTMMQQARWAGTIDGKGVASFMLDRVLTLSGLTPITEAMKRAYSRELMSFMARESVKTWRDLHPWTRDWLAQGGFDARTWDELRAMPLNTHRGVDYLRPPEVMERNQALGYQYLALLQREMSHSVLEGHTKVRAFMLGQTKPNTFMGETARTFWHIKTFPVTYTMLHFGQMMRDFQTPGRQMRGARYAAQLIVMGTAMAMLSMSLREIFAGRDPRRWFDEEGRIDPKFLGAAFLQSGGAGIYGDFLSAEVNRFGGGIASTAAGPLIDRYDQILRMTAGNVWQAADGKPTKFGREISQFIRQNTPMIWQTRLAYDRVIMDEFQKWADPEAYQAFNRQMQTRYRDYGRQQFWWQPGTTSWQRPPNFGAVLGRQ